MPKHIRRAFMFAIVPILAAVLVVADAMADTPITVGTTGTIECGTTQTPIIKANSTFNFTSLRCDNYNSATPVFVGFDGVGNAAPHVCIASSGCAGMTWAPEVVKGVPFCRVASTPTTIGCMWGN